MTRAIFAPGVRRLRVGGKAGKYGGCLLQQGEAGSDHCYGGAVLDRTLSSCIFSSSPNSRFSGIREKAVSGVDPPALQTYLYGPL